MCVCVHGGFVVMSAVQPTSVLWSKNFNILFPITLCSIVYFHSFVCNCSNPPVGKKKKQCNSRIPPPFHRGFPSLTTLPLSPVNDGWVWNPSSTLLVIRNEFPRKDRTRLESLSFTFSSPSVIVSFFSVLHFMCFCELNSLSLVFVCFRRCWQLCFSFNRKTVSINSEVVAACSGLRLLLSQCSAEVWFTLSSQMFI